MVFAMIYIVVIKKKTYEQESFADASSGKGGA